MILGIGLDIVDLASFRSQLDDPASSFLDRTFTPGERRAAESRPGRDPVAHLAARFAAKEAFVKAWSSSRHGRAPRFSALDLREIEVVQDPWHRPALCLHGRLAEAVDPDGEGIFVHLSLSHDGGFAAATVVLEQPTARTAPL